LARASRGGLGAVFLLARHLYWQGYVKSPADRKTGNVLSMLVMAGLLLANLAGMTSLANA
jgi:uncharacterized membrane protein